MLSCESRYSCAVGFDLSIPFSAILAGTFKGAGIIKNVPAKAKIIANPQIKKAALRFFIAFPNIPRQVSLAGGAGGSQASGAKALGLLFCQQALCLSGGMSDKRSSKL